MLEEVFEAECGHLVGLFEPSGGRVANCRWGAFIRDQGCVKPSAGGIETAETFGRGEVDGERCELGVDASFAGVPPAPGGDAETFGGMTAFEDGDGREVPIGEV